jgi:hypothetical protein
VTLTVCEQKCWLLLLLDGCGRLLIADLILCVAAVDPMIYELKSSVFKIHTYSKFK